jgi:hypothetical protein
MAEARAILEAGVTEETLKAVGERLAEAGSRPGFTPESEMRTMHGGDSSITVLQSDPDGLTLVLGRFSARAATTTRGAVRTALPQ